MGDAYRVNVQIVVWRKDVLQALFRCDRTNWCTFVVKNGKVDRQQVSIGQRSDLAAEIQQRVKQEDVVILHPTEQLKIGDRISLR